MLGSNVNILSLNSSGDNKSSFIDIDENYLDHIGDMTKQIDSINNNDKLDSTQKLLLLQGKVMDMQIVVMLVSNFIKVFGGTLSKIVQNIQ